MGVIVIIIIISLLLLSLLLLLLFLVTLSSLVFLLLHQVFFPHFSLAFALPFRNAVYSLSLDGKTLEQLSDSKHAVYSPRFNNTMDKLVRLSWFHNTL